MSQGSPDREDAPDHVRTDDTDATTCTHCDGVNGHHLMGCSRMSSDGDAKAMESPSAEEEDGVTYEEPPPPLAEEDLPLTKLMNTDDAGIDTEVEFDERNPAEGNDEIPPAKVVPGTEDGGRPTCGVEEEMGHRPSCGNQNPLAGRALSQEEIKEHFDTADKLFAGGKFEDGAVVEFDEQKLPPTDDDVVSSDMMWLVAKICHEVNRVYCQSISDWSQSEWHDAPEWQRESAFNGVMMHFENPDATSEDSHKSWLAEKVADGWKYGPVKDASAKQHPCLVPYNQLPPAQQYKDALFSVICKTFFGG